MDYCRLIKNLVSLPEETEWVEFKHNNKDPVKVGEYISALANSALFQEKSCAYLVWGVDDKTHEIVGTDFDFLRLKVGGEELHSWLRHQLSDNADFEFIKCEIDNKPMVILVVQQAKHRPVAFKGENYIRVGSYKKPLKKVPVLEKQIWSLLANLNFEDQIAKNDLSFEEVLKLLDYTRHFDLLNLPIGTDKDVLSNYLVEEGVIIQQDDGQWGISNLGAILLAKDFKKFGSLKRKALRIIQYKGNNRMETQKETEITAGYASSFMNMIDFINGMVPTNEVMQDALRVTTTMFPELAIRELVANSLIHQDLSVTGAGPMVEIFSDRIEISNPGNSLVKIDRIIDNPPKSRNDKIASLMRRYGFCEERGSGWDKIGLQCELYQLPAPRIDNYDDSIRVVLFGHVEFKAMDASERLRACYLHACLQYIKNDHLTNASLRYRFGLEKSNSATISRIINDSVEKGLIKLVDDTVGNKARQYEPYWA